MKKKKSLASRENEVEKSIFKDEIKDIKRQKHMWPPVFVWYFVLLAVLLVIAMTLKSILLLKIAALIFFGTLFVFTVMQFIDCLRMLFKEGESITKYALWLVLIVFFPFIGAFIYWLSKR